MTIKIIEILWDLESTKTIDRHILFSEIYIIKKANMSDLGNAKIVGIHQNPDQRRLDMERVLQALINLEYFPKVVFVIAHST